MDRTPAELLSAFAGPGEQDGWVYFMTAGPYVKIGWSADPIRRLPEIQQGCPLLVALAFAYPAERHVEGDLHKRFTLHAISYSREWFHCTGDLREYIDHLLCGGKPMWEDGTDWREPAQDAAGDDE